MVPVDIAGIKIGGGQPLALIAGPCVIEDERETLAIAKRLKEICGKINMPLIFKASYDKANRTSIKSFRGPGLAKGLEILAEVKKNVGCPVLSDIHEPAHAGAAAEVLDVLQIPAFLCRQTDLLVAAARTGRAINIKKAQFLAPWDMKNAISKVESLGNRRILLTERGTSFGYNTLVTDMRALPILRGFGYPAVFDATHSVQTPSGQGNSSGGDREMVPVLARAAVAAGVDAIFLEVHPEPSRALSDGANMVKLDDLPPMLELLQKLHTAVAPFI